MPAPTYTAADYVTRLQALLPRGAAWPRESSAVQTKVLTGLAESLADANDATNGMLADSFPATAVGLLPEWESTLGLPLPYGAPPATTSARQAAVVAALANTGGQSVSYLIALAASFGFTVTITQFKPWSVAQPIGAIYGDAWAHAFQVNASAADAVAYSPTADVVLATPGFGNPFLDALMAAAKPAQTVCVMSYT